MLTALASGILLGFSAGISPGPMLTLVLTQTLRHGWREGCKIALAPLLTDPPIILVTLLLASKLAQWQPLLGAISLAGGIFVLFLAWETFRPARPHATAAAELPRSWLKGIVTNLLNPHPWLFWLTVGTAMLANAMQRDRSVATAFLAGFYLLLVGSKIGIALLVSRSRNLLAGRYYRGLMQLLAGLLVLFALVLFREGLKHLSLI